MERYDDGFRVLRPEDLLPGAGDTSEGLDTGLDTIGTGDPRRRWPRQPDRRVAAWLAIILVASGVAFAMTVIRREPMSARISAPVLVPSSGAGATATPEVPVVVGPPEPPAATWPAGTETVSAAELGLGLLSGNDILTPEGNRFTLGLWPGYRAGRAVRIPGGWLVDAYHESGPSGLFLAGDRAGAGAGAGGAATYVARPDGGSAVSPDGTTVVTIGAEPGTLEVRELPSLTVVNTGGVGRGAPVVALDLTENWVLAKDTTGDRGPATAYAWNLRTGAVVPTDQPVELWGMSDDGRALRLMRTADAGCVDLVAMSKLTPVRPSGACSVDLGSGNILGNLSPAGTWAVVKAGEAPAKLVRTTDVTAGRWKPAGLTGLGPYDWFAFWTSDQTFVTRSDDAHFRHCHVDRGCTAIALPSRPDLPVPTLIR